MANGNVSLPASLTQWGLTIAGGIVLSFVTWMAAIVVRHEGILGGVEVQLRTIQGMLDRVEKKIDGMKESPSK